VARARGACGGAQSVITRSPSSTATG
jgi:hypothetical protein